MNLGYNPRARRAVDFCRAALACLLALSAASAQQPKPCQPPAVNAAARAAASIFTPQQEMDLGDVIAEHVQRDYRVIEDEAVTGFLRKVGASLVQRLPPSEMRYQFFVVDLPDANAFAMPGGRIYVTRKLIAFANSEDELAGVLAHELGHVVSGQTASDMSRLFREVLKVERVTDRRDIFEKYNQLLDNAARKPGAWRRGDRHEERDQYEADQIGIHAMAAAGYDPQAFATFWDRLADAKGKTGGWLSDLFGTTKPEARRLREILKGLQALPAECRTARASSSGEEFKKWQAAVVSHSGLGGRESVEGVISKIQLEPPLRGDITHLRFSPDGKYLLAQDDSGITVLTREPLAPAFRIDAPEARPARFTSDSRQVIFHTPSLRVETWSIADAKQSSAREMYVRDGCMQTELSPDARTLACLETNFALALYDVESGAQVFQKKDFYKPDFADLFQMIFLMLMREGEFDAADFGDRAEWVSMQFSPDGRYFAAGQRSVNFNGIGVTADTSAVIFDRSAGSTLPAKGLLKKILSGRFAFVGGDRVIGVNPEDYSKSGVVGFPGGEVVEQFPLTGTPDVPTRGNYLLLRPVGTNPVAVMDLASKKLFLANKQSAFDIYGDVFVAERANGELALYSVQTQQLVSKVQMPRNPLGRLRASAVSPDLKWLAVSERNRGAVWDLEKGARAFHIRGFRGAHFGDDGALYADFPAFEKTGRTIARLDLSTKDVVEHKEVEGEQVTQRGRYVVMTKPVKKGGGRSENVSITVSDTRTGSVYWTRDFTKEAPRVFVDDAEGTVVLLWAVKSDHAKAHIKSDPALAARLAAMKEKEGDYLLQVVDARTGTPSGSLLIETGKGSFRISGARSAGDWVVVSDTMNRVLLYSLSTGEQKAKVFGRQPAVSKSAGLLAVENERGQLSLYDLATGERRGQFTFPSAVALAHFSGDGRRLLVLTANQTAYLIDPSAGAKN